MFITSNLKTALRKLNFSKWPIIITLFFLNFGESQILVNHKKNMKYIYDTNSPNSQNLFPYDINTNNLNLFIMVTSLYVYYSNFESNFC